MGVRAPVTSVACYPVRHCGNCLSPNPSPTDAPKPRTPEESAAAFKLPAGFRMEVITSEPLLSALVAHGADNGLSDFHVATQDFVRGTWSDVD